MKALRGAVGAALVCTAVLGAACVGAIADDKPAKGETAAEGQKLFATKCQMCHIVGKTGGKIGPELTKVGKTRDAAWLTIEVRDPKKHEPKTKMPAYPASSISDSALKGLVAYMLTLK